MARECPEPHREKKERNKRRNRRAKRRPKATPSPAYEKLTPPKEKKAKRKHARKARRDSSTSSATSITDYMSSSSSRFSSSSSTSRSPSPKAKKARKTTKKGRRRAMVLRFVNPSHKNESSRCLMVGTRNHIKFLGDTGATDHFVNDLTYLSNAEELQPPRYVTCANKNQSADLIITHRGSLWVRDARGKRLLLRKVLYSEELSDNLFSFHKATKEGYEATFSEKGV